MSLTGPDNPLLCHYFCYYLKWVYDNLYQWRHPNLMDLTEAEDIKKRWQEYTEELDKKDFHDQIIMMV